jgi:hypothetical protein
MLREIASRLEELDRLHRLNLELMEQLDIACKFILKNIDQIPNAEKLRSLLSKADTLLTEIYSNNTKYPTIFYTKTNPTKTLQNLLE